MLVLKVVFESGLLNQEQTSLFYGESITHVERIETALDIKSYPAAYHIGSIIDELSETEFVASQVMIHDANRNLKDHLLILPKSSCFIMEGGKTVDSFSVDYK